MCTYSQLKKIMCNPPGVSDAPYVSKLYASSGIDISKYIEGGSVKFTTLLDCIYVCEVKNEFSCNECNFFLNVFFLFYFF